MDQEIDELFGKLFSIGPEEQANNVTKILVSLNYLLPGVFQHALDLIELHKVIRRDSLGKKTKHENEFLEGIFTRYDCTFRQGKEVWTVQPVVKEKKGGYTASPLQGTAWGYLVDLQRWHCSCQEFTKSKYTSGGDSEARGTSVCGWGGSLMFEPRRVPVCVHLVSVFVFTQGKSLFVWMAKHTGMATEAMEEHTVGSCVAEFPNKPVNTVAEWIVLCT